MLYVCTCMYVLCILCTYMVCMSKNVVFMSMRPGITKVLDTVTLVILLCENAADKTIEF